MTEDNNKEIEIKFVDEKFEVSDQNVVAPGISIDESADNNQSEPLDESIGIDQSGPLDESFQDIQTETSDEDFTQDDLLFISETLVNLPVMFYDRLPEREPAQVKRFNKTFYKYCKKKGIDPFEYMFDEMGLIIVTVGIAAGYKRDYKELYKTNHPLENTVKEEG